MASTASEPLILILDDEAPGPIEVIAAAPTVAGAVRIVAAAEDTAGQSLDGWTLIAANLPAPMSPMRSGRSFRSSSLA